MTTEIDFEQLVRGIGDGVIVCDAAGAITFWNDAATRIFGFTASDALGQSLDLIVPERQRQRHWDGYHKTAATGETRYGNDLLRVPALHKEGKPLSIAFTVAMLYNPAGAVASVIAVVRDDTARWSEERALKARVRELEAAARSEPVAS
ncbi:PAS domain-containing protein [Pseudoduganella umbonata]|uniref:PAS domain S-box protein n=1 Tax=Pseudoduganella umbonata TaxID=864828 RepID=A0A4P8HX85_9BURK|nr:PAS domain-containing protein [Pseudoduganella umbonata]MBB3222935.1 PAS domain S-box-containing protein [Pseudoduganella umbonata]QCP13055.1 PAS domain S-box protein [Pseudoduganella umbonata]